MRRMGVAAAALAAVHVLGCAGPASGPVDKGLMSDEEWVRAAGMGTTPYTETLDRLDVLGENGPIRGTVRRRYGENLEFWWPGGPTDWPYRALRDRLSDPEPLRNLYLVKTDPRRRTEIHEKVPVASPLETRILGTFHQLISRYVLEKEADRVLARYRETRKGRRLFDEGYSALEKRTLDLLDLTRFLEEQGEMFKEGAFPYWERRSVVFLSVFCDPEGKVQDAEILANYDRPEAADSLLQEVRGWILPPPDWEGRKPTRFKVLIPAAVDRREQLLARAPDPWWPAPEPDVRLNRFARVELVEESTLEAEALPAEVIRVLETGALSEWTRVFKDADPEFGVEDFLSTTRGRLPAMEAPGYWEREAERKRELGLLEDSPGGQWVLDPFFRLSPGKPRTGTVNLPGWSVASMDTGRTFHPWVWPGDEVHLGIWMDASHFVLAGWTRIEHPRLDRGGLLEFRVPAVWVGDTASWTFKKYLGAPVDPRGLPRVEERLDALVNAAYPPRDGF